MTKNTTTFDVVDGCLYCRIIGPDHLGLHLVRGKESKWIPGQQSDHEPEPDSPRFEFRTTPVDGEVEVSLARTWVENAIDLDLDIGRVVRTTKTTVRLAQLPDERDEALGAARYDMSEGAMDAYDDPWLRSLKQSAARVVAKLEAI